MKRDNKKTQTKPALKYNTSWGGVAKWYEGSVNKEDSYHKQLIIPNLMRMMDIKPNNKIIEMACGEGLVSRSMARYGALVSGVDISPELIFLAKNKSSKDINFLVSEADNVKQFSDRSFDKAVIVLALQNIENDQGVIKEFARLLNDKGRLYIILNHPCFRIPKLSEWGRDEVNKIQYRRLDRYISASRSAIEMHPGIDKRDVTFSFHRPLQHYFKTFNKYGFAVLKLEEWTSKKTSEEGPWSEAENRARKEFPMFLALELVKIS